MSNEQDTIRDARRSAWTVTAEERAGVMDGKRAVSGRSSGEGLSDVAALRARAAEMYALGKDASEVAAALGVTERQAKRYKTETAAVVKSRAADTIEGVVEAGARARSALAEHGESLAMVLVDAAHGRLEHGDANRKSDPIERDPQMINARTKAAGVALQFVLGHKIDATMKVEPLTVETAAMVAVIVRAESKGE